MGIYKINPSNPHIFSMKILGIKEKYENGYEMLFQEFVLWKEI